MVDRGGLAMVRERPRTKGTASLARSRVERVAGKVMVLYPLLAVVVFAVVLTLFFVVVVVLARDVGVV